MTTLYIENFPLECIENCTRPGQNATAAIQHWREVLGFTVPADAARECLAGYGAWDRTEVDLWDDNRLAECILWLACGDFSEWDGTADSPCGSDIFCIE